MKRVPRSPDWLALIVLSALLGASLGAHAQRWPLPDDVNVIDESECEIELTYERQTQRREPAGHERSVNLACGIGWGTELALGFSRLRSSGTSDKAVAVEGKTALPVAGPGGLTWAVIYGIDAERAGNGRWRRSEQYAALEAFVEFDRAWQFEATLGTTRDLGSRRNRTPWTLAIERTLARDIDLRAELDGDDHGRPMLGFELRHSGLFDDVEISLFAAARGAGSRERRIGLGVTFEF